MIKDEKTDVARGMCTEKGLSAQIKIAKQAKGGRGKSGSTRCHRLVAVCRR